MTEFWSLVLATMALLAGGTLALLYGGLVLGRLWSDAPLSEPHDLARPAPASAEAERWIFPDDLQTAPGAPRGLPRWF